MITALGFVIRTSMLLVCVTVLALTLRRASASVRHALWAIGLLAVLAFPVVSELLPKWDVPVLPAKSVVSRYDTSPLAEAAPIREPHVSLPGAVSETGAVSVSRAAIDSQPSPLPRLSWFGLSGFLWIAGSLLLIGRWIHSLWQLRRLSNGSSAVDGTELAVQFVEAQSAIGYSGKIQLRLCNDAIPPMTWGFFRHVILLPAAATVWPRERQRLVLAHELAHIRRRDAIGQLLAQAVRSVYWFNPLVWYAVRRLCAERERACDDYVLRMGAVDADYAEHLLEITRGLNSGFAQAAVSMAHPSQLKARLISILDSRIARSRASRFAASTLVALIGVVTLTIAAVQVTEISAMVLPVVAKPLGVPLGSLMRSPESSRIAEILEPAVEIVEPQPPTLQVVESQRAFISQYCLRCHNHNDWVANLSFEEPKNDIAHVTDNRALWEKVVRRLHLGIENKDFPPAAPPSAESLNSVIQYLEMELDRNSPVYVPPIGPHRLNRTEYANAIRDLLDLEINSKQLLPPDDISSGFDTIASTLAGTPKSREAYIEVAPLVSRLAVQSPPNSSSYQRIFACRPPGTVVDPFGFYSDNAACVRKTITELAETAFRGFATTSDIDGILSASRTPDEGIVTTLSKILANPKFLYRTEEAPADAKPGEAYRISDLALASRLSFFLWSTSPDAELIALAKQGKLHEPAILEQETIRMLQDYRAEALSLNFARQWLGLWPIQNFSPSPAFFPEFDESLRQDLQREVEMFFNSVALENRSVTELLTANGTFVNNRVARYYGIPGVSGNQFRRISLPDTLDARRGVLGKGALLMGSNNPYYTNRTSPVARGRWVMMTLLGFEPPPPPPNVPLLRQRSKDPSAVEPPVREMMEDHKSIRSACNTCHRFIDPIGYALENFNAIGAWRTEDGGVPINASDTLIDGTKVNGPVDLRNWIVSHSDEFIQTFTQKLLTYALGRGTDARDMPLIRAIDREAAKNGNRFSSIVVGIVKSDTFQMNSK